MTIENLLQIPLLADKKCSKCGLLKTAFDFNARTGSRDGLSAHCKECKAIADKRTRDLFRAVQGVTEKLCPRCSQVKPASEFHRNSKTRTGLASRCRECRHICDKAKPSPYVKKEGQACVPLKPCPGCKLTKESVEFHRSEKNLSGLSVYCKLCENERRKKRSEQFSLYRKNYREKNREKIVAYQRNHSFLQKYGISLEKYNEMLLEQDNACLICGCKEILTAKDGRESRLCVDHDHVTGKVRGLLCSQCNFGLGAFKEDETSLENAISYLKKHR